MSALAASVPDFVAARFYMVEGQLRPNTVRDERLLTAMETLPRELFVPDALAGVAYIDESVPVAANRFLLEPMVLARMIEALRLSATDHVLDIAPASGYSTAVLAQLVKSVVALESDVALAQRADMLLKRMEITNASIINAPFARGNKDSAPYKAVLVNGAVDHVPNTWCEQLEEGGRLAVIVRRYGAAHAAHTAEVRLYKKTGNAVTHHVLFEASAAVLPGLEAVDSFAF